MKSADDTTQTARSSASDSTLRVSRRNVLIAGGAGVSLLATTGVSTASNRETSSEAGPPTATVIGLEIDGPLEGCAVKYENKRTNENKRTTTGNSGTVVFENGRGPYQVALKKDDWHHKTVTVEPEGDQQEIYIPMYADDSLDD